MAATPTTADDNAGEPTPPPFRTIQPKEPVIALGLAVQYMIAKPAFSALRFGDWSRILIGQINRGHYFFAVNPDNRVVGFAGWALATAEKAEHWVTARRALSFEESRDGDCVIINAWSADNGAANRFLLAEMRKRVVGKTTLYFKRFYADGSVRPSRLAVNEFVKTHSERVIPALDDG